MAHKPHISDLDALRHSCAHLLAAAVIELYPKALRTIGPAIENGFYYDFDNLHVSEKDFQKIEKKMHELVQTWGGFNGVEVTVEEARKIFKDNPYKLELIEEFAGLGQKLTMYKSGNYMDLCRGGHDDKPFETLKFFKLTKLAGAYWRGDEKNKMLTRIYGTCWPTQEELDHYLWQIEEAEKRDHRKIGRELDLFTFSDLVGSGFPLYTPKGALIRRLLNDYVENLQSAQGYQQVWTPQVAKGELFKISGHYDKYKDDMFEVKSHYSKEEFFLKPMNCPHHTQIYASRQRSYKDLPIRLTDFAMLYRDEKPGQLNGLARVRAFSTDDCHIFCTEDQVDAEIDTALKMTKEIMNTFGFKYRYRLSTRDPNNHDKYLGDPATWERVEKWAVEIMRRNEINYFDAPGEAAFYAPKMDLMATDALGREWQLSTVQIDFVQPSRFKLSYVDTDGSLKTPVMIHRAILGSSERFMMVLLEHLAGNFPTWLAPILVVILPIADRHNDYASTVNRELESIGIRSQVDTRAETLGAKIRDAQNQKVPYMIVVGDKEIEANRVAVRSRDFGDQGSMELEKFISDISFQIKNKVLTLKAALTSNG